VKCAFCLILWRACMRPIIGHREFAAVRRGPDHTDHQPCGNPAHQTILIIATRALESAFKTSSSSPDRRLTWKSTSCRASPRRTVSGVSVAGNTRPTTAVFERWHCIGGVPDWTGIQDKLMCDVVVLFAAQIVDERPKFLLFTWHETIAGLEFVIGGIHRLQKRAPPLGSVGRMYRRTFCAAIFLS